MFPPLVQAMIEQHGYPVLGAEGIASYTREHEVVVLFFTGIMKPLPETADLAVILPELEKAFDGRFAPAVVAPGDQRPLQLEYRFRQWPALVFLRNGEYLGVITQVLDWADYGTEIERILAAAPSEPPPFFDTPEQAASHP